MSFRDVIDLFKGTVDPIRTKVKRLPEHILVFGGKQGIDVPRLQSCRNVFLQKSTEKLHPLSSKFVMPEDYPEWNNYFGYDNLVDFEVEAGCLSRAIVLFLETEGSFAELGAFCMDEALRERLFVVLARKYYDAKDSFLYLGPIALVTNRHGEESLCVVDEIVSNRHNARCLCAVEERRNGEIFEQSIDGILQSLEDRLRGETKASKPFSASRKRDQFLLIADFIDLFGALNRTELHDLLRFMGLDVADDVLKRMLWLLNLFGMVRETNVFGKVYFVSIRHENHNYLDFSAVEAGRAFDRSAFKVNTVSSALKGDKNRKKACDDQSRGKS